MKVQRSQAAASIPKAQFLRGRRLPWVERALRQMTVDQKVGQLLMPAAHGTFRSEDSEEFERLKRNIVQFHVGGYHMMSGDPVAQVQLVNRMQRLARLPLLISADTESGAGSVWPGATRLPRPMAIGATGNAEFANEVARLTAAEARALGVHINFRLPMWPATR
jgi:beta-N-acetylhexosaminidase